MHWISLSYSAPSCGQFFHSQSYFILSDMLYFTRSPSYSRIPQNKIHKQALLRSYCLLKYCSKLRGWCLFKSNTLVERQHGQTVLLITYIQASCRPLFQYICCITSINFITLLQGMHLIVTSRYDDCNIIDHSLEVTFRPQS